MIISSFSRIDTVTVPDVFLSVVRVSDGGEGLDADVIRSSLEADRESLDYLAVTSDSDPLCYPDLYKLIKTIRPSGIKVMIITDGRDPSVLDDLIGAGYAHAVDLKIGRALTESQRECAVLTADNKCPLIATIDLDGQDGDSISAIACSLEGCKTIVLKQAKNKPLTKSEISALFAAAKRHIWNVKLS